MAGGPVLKPEANACFSYDVGVARRSTGRTRLVRSMQAIAPATGSTYGGERCLNAFVAVDRSLHPLALLALRVSIPAVRFVASSPSMSTV